MIMLKFNNPQIKKLLRSYRKRRSGEGKEGERKEQKPSCN